MYTDTACGPVAAHAGSGCGGHGTAAVRRHRLLLDPPAPARAPAATLLRLENSPTQRSPFD